MRLRDGRTLRTHLPEECEGQACCVHHPSAHPMRDWPQVWRPDRGLMERTCPHGVGHPDPDHLSHVRRVRGQEAERTDSIHGCDGCCAPPAAKRKPKGKARG